MKKTISGGERKRTSIGVELITDPSVVLLDEPTSGLDSFRAVKIVELLQKLAHDKGKTIISTIHQPSSAAFYYFDRLILMADGYIVYQGDVRKSPAYFEKLNYTFSKFSNPADVFMRYLSINYPKTEVDEQKISLFTSTYQKELAHVVEQEIKEFEVADLDIKRNAAQTQTFGTQFEMLMFRNKIFAKREPQAVIAKIGNAVFVAVLVNFLYHGIGNQEPSISQI